MKTDGSEGKYGRPEKTRCAIADVKIHGEGDDLRVTYVSLFVSYQDWCLGGVNVNEEQIRGFFGSLFKGFEIARSSQKEVIK